MADQTFEEWMSSEHMKTFILMRMKVHDETPVDYLNQPGLIANEAVRRELRVLQSWRPSVTVKEEQEIRQTRYKAAEHERNLVERLKRHA